MRKVVQAMFSSAYEKVAYEQASIARDIEYMRENVLDTPVTDAVARLDEDYDITFEDAEMIAEALNDPRLESDSDEEVKRILDAETDTLSLDDIIGIDTDEGEDFSGIADAMSDLSPAIDDITHPGEKLEN